MLAAYRRFGTAYWFHLQGQINPRKPITFHVLVNVLIFHAETSRQSFASFTLGGRLKLVRHCHPVAA
jgi:hypothetical protein